MMFKNQTVPVIAFLLLISCLFQCSVPPTKTPVEYTLINTSHLDALYDQLVVGGDTVGIAHIYSEYPDYHMVGDADEGIACVDDASRAAIFYLRHYQRTSSAEHLRKGKMLIRFLLAMQAPNGYYYNFVWQDGSINRDGRTSLPEPNFWSWRALWAFGEAIEILKADDPIVNEIRKQRQSLVRNILAEKSFRSNETDTTMGIAFATWLPKISGTDQASIVLIGLSMMLKQETKSDPADESAIIPFMEHFADGIAMMQIEQPDSLHDGAFLSWENLWHAYANIQSYALLVAGETLRDPHMISHAIYELDHFYPAFLKAGGLEHFFVKAEDGKIARYDTKAYPQIAYGRRPMVWAALKAYDLTDDKKYLSMAIELSSWFLGINAANVSMYEPETGRGFDGLIGPGMFNKNAGAESTIESLLALQALEKYNEH